MLLMLITFVLCLAQQVQPLCAPGEQCAPSEECGVQPIVTTREEVFGAACDEETGYTCCAKDRTKKGSLDLLSPTFLPTPTESEHLVPFGQITIRWCLFIIHCQGYRWIQLWKCLLK